MSLFYSFYKNIFTTNLNLKRKSNENVEYFLKIIYIDYFLN